MQFNNKLNIELLCTYIYIYKYVINIINRIRININNINMYLFLIILDIHAVHVGSPIRWSN